MELKEMNTEEKSFMANGHKYIVESSLSIERYIAFQKIEVELAYGVGFLGVFNAFKKALEHLNKMQLADAIVILHNTLQSITKLDNKKVPALDMCSLFINREDEDRRYISDEMLADKQKDWEIEGIPADFFLSIALNLVRGYKEVLKSGVSVS
jgi:hypothetical protein